MKEHMADLFCLPAGLCCSALSADPMHAGQILQPGSAPGSLLMKVTPFLGQVALRHQPPGQGVLQSFSKNSFLQVGSSTKCCPREFQWHKSLIKKKSPLNLGYFKACTVFAITNALKTGFSLGSRGALNQLPIKKALMPVQWKTCSVVFSEKHSVRYFVPLSIKHLPSLFSFCNLNSPPVSHEFAINEPCLEDANAEIVLIYWAGSTERRAHSARESAVLGGNPTLPIKETSCSVTAAGQHAVLCPEVPSHALAARDPGQNHPCALRMPNIYLQVWGRPKNGCDWKEDGVSIVSFLTTKNRHKLQV